MEQNNRKQFEVTEEIFAKLGQRFLNWLVDTTILIALVLILMMIIDSIAKSYGNKQLMPYLLINPIGQYTFVTIVRLAYYISFETLFAQSIGKMVTKTIVVGKNGERPTHEVILIRSLCRLIPLYELSFLLNPTRGWHDMISKTYVVDKRELEARKQSFHPSKQ
jgi:uncharacterized RDD family membrane protein YckC